jgi:hypothetical protein
VIGNSLATAVVAKWEGEDVTAQLPEAKLHPQPVAAS